MTDTDTAFHDDDFFQVVDHANVGIGWRSKLSACMSSWLPAASSAERDLINVTDLRRESAEAAGAVRGQDRAPRAQDHLTGQGNIQISTQYQHNIYNMYTISTLPKQYLKNIYTLHLHHILQHNLL